MKSKSPVASPSLVGRVTPCAPRLQPARAKFPRRRLPDPLPIKTLLEFPVPLSVCPRFIAFLSCWEARQAKAENPGSPTPKSFSPASAIGIKTASFACKNSIRIARLTGCKSWSDAGNPLGRNPSKSARSRARSGWAECQTWMRRSAVGQTLNIDWGRGSTQSSTRLAGVPIHCSRPCCPEDSPVAPAP